MPMMTSQILKFVDLSKQKTKYLENNIIFSSHEKIYAWYINGYNKANIVL